MLCSSMVPLRRDSAYHGLRRQAQSPEGYLAAIGGPTGASHLPAKLLRSGMRLRLHSRPRGQR